MPAVPQDIKASEQKDMISTLDLTSSQDATFTWSFLNHENSALRFGSNIIMSFWIEKKKMKGKKERKMFKKKKLEKERN